MRFVAVKTRDTQARAALYRTRALFVQQRMQTANAIRSHLLEFGVICGRGFAALGKLRDALDDGTLKTPEPLPGSVPATLAVLFDQVERLTTQIDDCETEMRAITATDPDARRYHTVPGVGPITAFALLAFAGDLAQFKNGREFAAWIGLTPREFSTGGTASGRYHQDGITGSAVSAGTGRHGAGATQAAEVQRTVPRHPGSASDQT